MQLSRLRPPYASAHTQFCTNLTRTPALDYNNLDYRMYVDYLVWTAILGAAHVRRGG